MKFRYIIIPLIALLTLALPVVSQAQADEKDAYYEAAKQKMLGNFDLATELYENYIEKYPDDAAALYELADIYISQDQVDKALPLAEKAVKLDGNNKWYKMMLVQLYQSMSRYDDARKILESLLESDPRDVSYIEELALNSLYTGDYKDALKYYDRIEELVGLNEELSEQKEKIYLMMGKPDKAISEIQRLVESDPYEVRYYEMLAELYMSDKQYDKALATYQKIQEIDPDNPYINISLSDYYRKQGDHEKAFEYLKAGFANPDLDIDTKVQILLAYYSVNEIYNAFKDEAFTLSEILVKTHPDEPKAYSIYADLLYQDKRYQEARDAFHEVIALDSTKYLVWEQLLFTESDLEDYPAMAAESDRALAMFPQQPMLYFFAGFARFSLKEYEKAAYYFRQGINFVVGNDRLLSQFYSFLGDTYYQLKDNEKSDDSYEKALKIDPANSLVLNNYAYYLSLRNQDLDKAEEMAKKAVDLDPENGANQDTYGWVLYKLGRYQEAREWIDKAIQNRENSGTVLEHYGDVLFKLGDSKEAVKYWEKAQKAGDGSSLLEKKIRDKTLYE